MLKKNNKEYDKALKLYNNGNINKALEILDRGITRDLSNSNLLNLKGLLLYIKGSLEESIAIWNINRDYNDDKISSAYLKDVKNDYEKIEFYNKAKLLVENLNIDQAIELLDLCKESDFNCINVNSLMGLCYLKKGNYDQSQKYINKVLEIDKANSNAIIIKKEIEKFTKQNSISKLILIPAIIILSILGIFSTNKFINIYKGYKVDVSNEINMEVSEFNDNISKEEEVVLEENTASKENIELEEKEENIQIEVKNLSEEEIKNNYLEASDYYDKKDYLKTKDILEDTIISSHESHLNDDIMFLLAATYENIKDTKNAISKYEEYINVYKDGTYIQESYYKLALLYKEVDLDKSKNYANIIMNNYSDSIYNNNVIKEILET